MSFFPTIAPAFLEEMVAHLLHLFIRGAGGDEAAARYAVLSTLAAYDPEDEQELRLAAKIISFGFAALQALAKAMNPDLPLNRFCDTRKRQCRPPLRASVPAHVGQAAEGPPDGGWPRRRTLTRARNTGRPLKEPTRPSSVRSAGPPPRPVAPAAPGTGTQSIESTAETG